MSFPKVLICGTGDHATACALRLFRAGLAPVLLSPNSPCDLHHHRTFTRAVYLGSKSINSVRARTWSNALENKILDFKGVLNDFIQYEVLNREIPIVLENDLKRGFKFPVDFAVLLDERIAETALAHLDDDSILIGLQDRLEQNIHYRIATDSVYLGQVIYPFNEDIFAPNKKSAISVNEKLKAPKDGIFQTTKEVGQSVFKDDEIGMIDDMPLKAPKEGIIYGQLNSGIFIRHGQEVVEIGEKESIDTIRILPKESFAIAGGVLEAILFHQAKHTRQD